MNNFRITFAHNFEVDYWKDFAKCRRELYPAVEKVMNVLHSYGISEAWWFYEPYVEITWLASPYLKHDMLKADLEKALKEIGIIDVQYYTPNSGQFADWFCTSDEERQFGAERHVASSMIAQSYHAHQSAVDNGKGLHAQVGRTIHTICNPLGLNYKDEALICFRRGLICLLFTLFSFHRAVWIYRNIFRQTY